MIYKFIINGNMFVRSYSRNLNVADYFQWFLDDNYQDLYLMGWDYKKQKIVYTSVEHIDKIICPFIFDVFFKDGSFNSINGNLQYDREGLGKDFVSAVSLKPGDKVFSYHYINEVTMINGPAAYTAFSFFLPYPYLFITSEHSKPYLNLIKGVEVNDF